MPVAKLISKVVAEAAAAPTRGQKIAVLRQNDSYQLRGYLNLLCNPNLTFALPPGAPPYKPCQEAGNETWLQQNMDKMYLYLKDGHKTLKQARREQLFITLLEGLPPTDAEFLISVKDKKLPEGLDPALIHEALPGTFK